MVPRNGADMRLPIIAIMLLIAAAAPAQETHADAAAPQGEQVPSPANLQPYSDPSALFGGGSGAFVGLAVRNIQGEGAYAATVVNADLSLGSVGLGLSVPLNL